MESCREGGEQLKKEWDFVEDEAAVKMDVTIL